jgi:hypothetical protein
VHWLLHLANDSQVPHVFRPDSATGDSRGQPAFVLGRVASQSPHGAIGPTHVALLTAPTAAEVDKRMADAKQLQYAESASGSKRKRAAAESVLVVD